MEDFQLTHGTAFAATLVFFAASSGLLADDPNSSPSATTLSSPPAADASLDLQQLQAEIQAASAKIVASIVEIRVGESQGSGVIVSPSGLVLTAAHVIKAPGRKAELTLASGRKVHGVTLGLDASTDTAMMKISDPGSYPFVKVAEADSLQPGQWCLAAGFPGRRPSDGKAILRLGRVLFTSPTVVGTDCTLIGGDSGGPLFNLAREVVGIHSRIGMRLTTNLHVPIGVFHATWGQLEAGESLGGRRAAPNAPEPGTRPLIGVTGQPDQQPCTINRVFPASPAAEAGLKAGDVVQKIDGRPVADFRHLAWMLHDMQPGQMVKFELIRGDTTLEVAVELGTARGPIPGGAPPRTPIRKTAP